MNIRPIAAAFAALTLAATLSAGSSAPAKAKPAATSAASDDARKAQILANLMIKFPDLGGLNARIEDLKPIPGATGIDTGFMVITPPAQPGQPPAQPQRNQFIVTRDNKSLWFSRFPEALDVSKSGPELEAEKQKQAEAAKQAEAERQKAEEERRKAEAERAKTARPEFEAAAKGLPVRGNADAKITVYEFSDFQCPYCARGAQTVEALLKKHNDIKFVFMNYPLTMHPWAKPAAIAGQCAAKQSPAMFWKLHDFYFGNQGAITPDNVIAKSQEVIEGAQVVNPKTKKREFPKDMAFNLDAWKTCAAKPESPEYAAAAKAVDDQTALGTKYGINGTPGFFVNGRRVDGGAVPPESFDPVLDAERKAQ